MKLGILATSILVGLAGIACGSDDDDTSTNYGDGGDAATDAGTGAGGTGNAAGGTSSGGTSAGGTSTGTGTGGTGSDTSCEEVQCFRAVICVSECGGTESNNGCCPCPEGSFDTATCPQ